MITAMTDRNIRESDPRRRFRHQKPSRLSRLRPLGLVFAPISSACHKIDNGERACGFPNVLVDRTVPQMTSFLSFPIVTRSQSKIETVFAGSCYRK
jgi:hypothetical protein